RISNRGHVILAYHLKLEEVEEEGKGAKKMGTRKKGMGGGYMEKAGGMGIRVGDVLDGEVFEEKVGGNVEEKNGVLEKMYEGEGLKIEDIL
uniref:adenylosuccinate synthetase n=1 Tax=Bacillus pumilus TaxID=1408 RepID=UPI00164261F2